ncbi:unnamed protein product [Cyclocybe aegerita]|uniref:MARVEL domain-containing protein n=1 Tax=Cyclocybe aegerita TaxID=1973307 RepID=A0A8S0XRM0_CYCAE|nr:unnamed protein product [Cyclocybe aegerita]
MRRAPWPTDEMEKPRCQGSCCCVDTPHRLPSPPSHLANMMYIIRAILYILLFACSSTLLGLTAYRINYTGRLNTGDILTFRRRFYDPVVVELLVTACLGIIISVAFLASILARAGKDALTYALEHICLITLWILFLVGSGVFTSRWSNLGWCRGYKSCRILETIKAFSWICWALVTLLILSSLYNMIQRKSGWWSAADGRKEREVSGNYPETRATTTTTASHTEPLTA